MAWEWRVVSLKDIFPGEELALCVRNRDVGPEEDLGGWKGADASAESKVDHSPQGDGQEQGDGLPTCMPACQPAGRGGGESSRESPAAGGDARITSVPMALVAVEGRPGSERAVERQGRDDLIDVDAEPPPPPGRQAPLLSVGSESRHTRRVRLRRSWERGRQ